MELKEPIRESDSLRMPFFKLLSRRNGEVLEGCVGVGPGPKFGAFCSDVRLVELASIDGNAMGGVSILNASESNAYSSGTMNIFWSGLDSEFTGTAASDADGDNKGGVLELPDDIPPRLGRVA